MRALLVVLLLVSALLSGCFAEDGGDDDGSPSTGDDGGDRDNATVGPEVVTGSGTATVSTTVGGLSQGGIEVTVDEGATLLFAELRWADPVADLDLALASPASESAAGETNWDHTAQGGMPGAPDSPHSLSIEAPDSGAWQGGAIANGAAANVAYDIAVTVFYGETAVPEGYSAFA